MDKKIFFLPITIIDSHCHGRDMEQAYKITIKQTLVEAQNGNIGTSVFMPNTEPAIITAGILDQYLTLIKQAKNETGLKVNQYLYFGLTDDNLSECEKALKYPEVVGLKAYPKGKSGKMVTTGSCGVSKESTIFKGMKLTREYNKVFAVHSDDPDIIAQEGNTIKAEIEYARKIIRLASKVPGVKVVNCHVSCVEHALLILEAQMQRINIAMEIMPHYLFFDSDGTNWNTSIDPVFYHCYNNLRPKVHREYLIKLLFSGNEKIFVGSDCACHTKEEKLKNRLGGIPSNQEMVPATLTLALALGIPDNQVANLLSFNAARFLNISVEKKLIKYELEKRPVIAKYNQGKVVNPWQGLELYFPTRKL